MINKKLLSEIKLLRTLLIGLTLIQIGQLIISLVAVKLWVKLDFEYKVNWLIFALNFILAGIFIWFNWTKMPFDKKTKKNNTLMILFLGVIGMWLWIPDQREINQMMEKQLNNPN